MQIKNKRATRLLSLFLAIFMLFSAFPTTVFAGNNDNLPASPSYGVPDKDWLMHENYHGMRLSLYWAPSLEDFRVGSKAVQKIGETVDVSAGGPKYKVVEYTKMSIYEYMNNDKLDYNGRTAFTRTRSIDVPYEYATVGEVFLTKSNGQKVDIVNTMPKYRNNQFGTKAEWDAWFEGPVVDGVKTYENIPAIANILGATITSEDFGNGVLREVDGIVGEKSKQFYLQSLSF